MFNKYIIQFMDDLTNKGYSVLTLVNYKSDLHAFSHWFNETNDESLTPSSITSLDLKEYVQYLDVTKQQKPATMQRKLASIKSFLNWAHTMKHIDYILPTPKIKRDNRPSAPHWLTKKQQHALLRAAEKSNTRDYAIISLFLNTGLRVSELCALKWLDIHISPRKGKLIVRHGKGNTYREVPLNADARKALEALKLLASEHGSDENILHGQRGALSPRGVQFLIKRLSESSSILDDITVHQLRHTFCKNLINAGVGIEKVADLAGHTRLETTRMYCKPSMGDLTIAVEQISIV